MRRSYILTLLLASLLTVPAGAQKRKNTSKRKATVAEVKEPTKFDMMLSNTQKVIFIDSIVVDKKQFLNYYMLGEEAGTVSDYETFFSSESQPFSTVYMNELGNKCWYSENGKLYTRDMLNNAWSESSELLGLGDYQRKNYPFMLSDGVTFYFSAIGEDGLGGLDIYVSRYDQEEGKFLIAENIGLPFNSEANDYMYAVDELNDIGYFATDRNQAEGKVCIYTFIPNDTRVVYQIDELGESVVSSRARINRIADTWGDGKARTEALNRLQALGAAKTKKRNKGDFEFVISDDVTYTRLSDFKDINNRDRYTELTQMKKRFKAMEDEIDKSRQYYATRATVLEKTALNAEFMKYEKAYYQMEENIRTLEKMIRNSEIKLLNP